MVDMLKKNSKEFYKTMSKAASILTSIHKKNYEESMNRALKILGDFAKADRTYIFKYDFIANTTSNTFEYCAKNISKEIDHLQDIPLDGIPDWVNAHKKGEDLYLPDVMKLPKYNRVRQILEPQGVKSLLTIPLVLDERLYGFLGFDSVRKKKRYSKFEKYILHEYSNVLTMAINRIEVEETLNLEKIRSDTLAEAIDIGIWEWDLEYDKVQFNNIWANMIGYSLDEIDQSLDTWKKLTHPEDLKESMKLLKKVIDGNSYAYENIIRLRHKNGEYIWIKDIGKVISYTKNGKPKMMIGAHIDITKQKEQEIALKTVTQAVDQSSQSIIITNSQANILYVNPAFTKMTGYESAEVIGKNPNILQSGEHEAAYYKKMWNMLSKGNIWLGEFRNKRKDGTLYWEQASISPVFDEFGKISKYIAVKEDITKKKEVSEELEQRRRELESEISDKMNEIEDSQRAAIIALAKLTESRDSDTGKHVDRVQYLTKAIAVELKDNSPYKSQIEKNFINDIYLASALHDIGKISIPDNILIKPGKLTKEEFDVIKTHVNTGSEILLEMGRYYPRSSVVVMGQKIAKYHHEKWDGTGYQQGLKGLDIPLEARIMALVDVYDALRSKRPYKEPYSHEEARHMIVSESGKHFDPIIVDAFIRINQQFELIFESLL